MAAEGDCQHMTNMRRKYYLHDDSVVALLNLLNSEIERCDKLGDHRKKAQLETIAGEFEYHLPDQVTVQPTVEEAD